MTFFLDNDLSIRLALGLRGFGEDVRHLREEFDPATPDTVWLPEVGSRGWYLITRDKQITRKPAEVQALKSAGVGAFVFTQRKDVLLWGWVKAIVRRWEEIHEWSRTHQRPFVVGIPERGRMRPM